MLMVFSACSVAQFIFKPILCWIVSCDIYHVLEFDILYENCYHKILI